MSLNGYSLFIPLVLLCGCSILRVLPPQPLPLPPSRILPCCWQSTEQIQVTDPDGSREFLAAVSFTSAKCTIVILDYIGQRLLTIIHDSNGLQTLEAPDWWQMVFSRQLLTAVYLHYIDREDWQIDEPGWEIIWGARHKSVVFKGREQVRLDYVAGGKQSDRKLTFRDRDITLDVRTLSRTPL